MQERVAKWSQQANTNSNTVWKFLYFLYEFLGARFTIIAFVTLFSVVTVELKIFGYILTTGVSLFLYYIIYDAFNVFWTGINLRYSISNDGIYFDWGVMNDHSLFVPFDKITNITAIINDNDKRYAIIFENELNYKNGDHGFSKDLHFGQLSFENVNDIDNVINLIEEVSFLTVERIVNKKTIPLTEKLPTTGYYPKFLQLIAFGFIYLGTHTSLKLIDSNMLYPDLIQDRILKQELVIKGGKYKYSRFHTEKGRQFDVRDYYVHDEKEIEYLLSPIFKDVCGYYNPEYPKEEFINSYQGYNVPPKLIALFVMILAAGYIFYRRGIIPFDELSIILLAPALILILAYVLFH